MGLADAFNKEDRVEVKFTDFYEMMYAAAKAELIENAVRAKVPNKYISNMLSIQESEE